MPGHKLRVEGAGPVCKQYCVWLDGHELQGLNSLKLEWVAGEANYATLRLLVDEVVVVPPLGPYSEPEMRDTYRGEIKP